MPPPPKAPLRTLRKSAGTVAQPTAWHETTIHVIILSAVSVKVMLYMCTIS